VLDTVYTALLEERHFKVRYRKRGEKTSSERIVNPLGLVYRSSMAYLVCTLPADEEPVIKQLLLHRMSQPELLEGARSVPKGFDLDDYIATGSFGFSLGRSPVRLKAAFDPRAAVAVQESALSKDQKLSERRDGWIVVEATVPNTIELSVWLLGFGAMVEVLEPKALRQQFQELTRELAALYGGRRKKTR
jgi:predicted DNA-binding transcriptional regulator YafY